MAYLLIKLKKLQNKCYHFSYNWC